jgi:hypothetical protein
MPKYKTLQIIYGEITNQDPHHRKTKYPDDQSGICLFKPETGMNMVCP